MSEPKRDDYPNNVMTARMIKNQKTGHWFIPPSEAAPFGAATSAFEHLEAVVGETRKWLDRSREEEAEGVMSAAEMALAIRASASGLENSTRVNWQVTPRVVKVVVPDAVRDAMPPKLREEWVALRSAVLNFTNAYWEWAGPEDES